MAVFGTYVDLTAICVANAKTEIRALFVEFGRLHGVTFAADMLTYTIATSVALPHTDFDKMGLDRREQIGTELVALYASIEAAPVA